MQCMNRLEKEDVVSQAVGIPLVFRSRTFLGNWGNCVVFCGLGTSLKP
jgi:hypothetical protein